MILICCRLKNGKMAGETLVKCIEMYWIQYNLFKKFGPQVLFQLGEIKNCNFWVTQKKKLVSCYWTGNPCKPGSAATLATLWGGYGLLGCRHWALHGSALGVGSIFTRHLWCQIDHEKCCIETSFTLLGKDVDTLAQDSISFAAGLIWKGQVQWLHSYIPMFVCAHTPS